MLVPNNLIVDPNLLRLRLTRARRILAAPAVLVGPVDALHGARYFFGFVAQSRDRPDGGVAPLIIALVIVGTSHGESCHRHDRPRIIHRPLVQPPQIQPERRPARADGPLLVLQDAAGLADVAELLELGLGEVGGLIIP